MRQKKFAIVLLVALLGACAGEAEDDEIGQMNDTAAAGAEETAQAPQHTISVMLSEWTIQMPDTLAAGPTRFDVMNHGTVVHGFEVEGQGIEEEIESIDPGATAQLVVELQPGSYEVYCPVTTEQGAHDDLGMRKQIVVQ